MSSTRCAASTKRLTSAATRTGSCPVRHDGTATPMMAATAALAADGDAVRGSRAWLRSRLLSSHRYRRRTQPARWTGRKGLLREGSLRPARYRTGCWGGSSAVWSRPTAWRRRSTDRHRRAMQGAVEDEQSTEQREPLQRDNAPESL